MRCTSLPVPHGAPMASPDDGATGRPAARTTVVIVNYNGAHLLPPCLDGLARQDLPEGAFRTVVVDNASVDGSRELLARDYPWVEVIASRTNTGFAGGNNLALRRLDTPYAVLLNNDAVPEPGWLRTVLAPLEREPALGAVTGKVVFAPRFLRLTWQTPGFSPGPHDPRDLGARVYRVEVGDRDVTDKVLWERLTFGPEGTGEGRFRWTKPGGELLVPVQDTPGDLAEDIKITFRVAAETVKPLRIAGPNGTEVQDELGTERTDLVLAVPAGTALVDVINNVGGIVLTGGYGADRGFQEVDTGQYDTPCEVFTGCGNGMAIRATAGREVGWFDDDFFMYYEDTDLSWRLRSRGWGIRYEPSAVLRHVHSASSVEWSPRWVFHVDRNRLLMLTKDASARLATSAVLRYPLTATSIFVRALREGLATRRRPALRPHLLRVRVMASYLSLLAPMLVRRRRIARRATVARDELERWLADRR
ncbi:MAG: glycosyltransferase family 2 protein [Actinobacteria bacterium]|nr:glycosyltransferase family 2 protein [Actinomycetota bacterium]MBI3687863.1 glycosyltransferase family 2 protein [Actinomycetota bacterium]